MDRQWLQKTTVETRGLKKLESGIGHGASPPPPSDGNIAANRKMNAVPVPCSIEPLTFCCQINRHFFIRHHGPWFPSGPLLISGCSWGLGLHFLSPVVAASWRGRNFDITIPIFCSGNWLSPSFWPWSYGYPGCFFGIESMSKSRSP